jgi:TolB protein
MSADGTARRRGEAVDGGVHLMPAWSPDGRRIAFISSRAGDLALWVMDPDGRNQRRLAPVAGDFSVLPIFSWKPR